MIEPDEMDADELRRELAMAIGVIRAFRWVMINAQTNATCVAPDDAFDGRTLREYRRAMQLSSRYRR